MNNTCPLCKEKIDKGNEIEKIQSAMINVQTVFYPIYNNLAFTGNADNFGWEFPHSSIIDGGDSGIGGGGGYDAGCGGGCDAGGGAGSW